MRLAFPADVADLIRPRQFMDDTTKYIHDSIKLWVWSGFYSPSEVDSMIDDILEEGADEGFLRRLVAPEFVAKREAERGWPACTDCDRLDQAFRALDEMGILALQNAGNTMSDGHSDAAEALEEKGRNKYFGYCFYHGQDLERAVDGGGLMIAFDHVDGDVPEKQKVGVAVVAELERAGLKCDWGEDVNTRVCIPRFDWKKRGPVTAGIPTKKRWWKIF